MAEFKAYSYRFALFCAIAATGFTALGQLADIYFLFEIVVSYQLHYFAALLLASLVFCCLQKWRSLAIFSVPLLFSFLQVSFVFDHSTGYLPAHASDRELAGDQRRYRAIFANVLYKNNDTSRFIQLIEKERPDFFVIAESTQRWRDGLRKLEREYRYNYGRNDDSGWGIALYSRIPPCQVTFDFYSDLRLPMLGARLTVNGRRLWVLGKHIIAPTNHTNTIIRSAQLKSMKRYLASIQPGEEIMLMGDFNMTRWSPFYRALIRDSGLRNTLDGFGFLPTWPAGFPPIFAEIDHCLVSRNVRVLDRRSGPRIGSDHLPIIVDFTL